MSDWAYWLFAIVGQLVLLSLACCVPDTDHSPLLDEDSTP